MIIVLASLTLLIPFVLIHLLDILLFTSDMIQKALNLQYESTYCAEFLNRAKQGHCIFDQPPSNVAPCCSYNSNLFGKKDFLLLTLT